ncbi:YL1 nuclear protein [Cooperia oncophora]
MRLLVAAARADDLSPTQCLANPIMARNSERKCFIYEQFELERKKKREHAQTKRRVPPPYISIKDTLKETTVVVPDIKVFKRPEVKPTYVCAVTGQPARYRDPITGLPYSTPFTFKIIRDKYHKYLKTIKDNPEVTEYMKQFE